MLTKLLIANRGEIACRILRTCRRLGVATVAVYSDADEAAPHVTLADEAVRIGPPPPAQSYLNSEAILAAARATSAVAIHPGYGMLSENAAFAGKVAEAGLTFVGPSPHALSVFGDKIEARRVARAAGVLPPPGSDDPVDPSDASALRKAADFAGFPVIVKAAGGGGGIGMQIVDDPAKLDRAVRTCSDRGRASFGDPRVYLERYLLGARHIEVQILADRVGHRVALGDRECSVQRRHQKILEESPSPASFFAGEAGEQRRLELFDRALRVVGAVGYEGAGTVEFVASAEGDLFFLEVNARLQVEHCVTEMCTGIDLVEAQLRVASGEPLSVELQSVRPRGHAIEARIYAEDPAKKFAPQPGRLEKVRWPAEASDLRVETGVVEGMEVTPYYDPLLAKIVAHGEDRAAALGRLDEALAATCIDLVGPVGKASTNLGFLRRVLAFPAFAAGDYDTRLVGEIAAELVAGRDRTRR